LKRLRYLIRKTIATLKNGAFPFRLRIFLHNSAQRYILLPLICIFNKHYWKRNNLNLISGYVDHRSDPSSLKVSRETVERIVRAYKCAIRDRKTKEGYQVSGLWSEWIQINYKGLIDALVSEDFGELDRLFNNLFREQVTRGLGGYDEWTRFNSLFGECYIRVTWKNYYKKLIDLEPKSTVDFPKVGNPCGVYFEGKLYPIESLRHAYRAEEVESLLADVQSPLIVEIGGGYGGFAYQLMSRFKESHANIYLYDIPEVLAIASAFLITALPSVNVKLHGEDIQNRGICASSIQLLPHFTIDSLLDNSVDLFYNSCSFSEMSEDAVSEYLQTIERVCRRYFMHDNHETVLSSRMPGEASVQSMVGSRIKLSSESFKRIYKKCRTHGLPEDRYFQHFEYLYEKRR